MGRLISIHDKDIVEAFLMKDPLANVLAIGDLDDFFWPSTVWYGWEDNGKLIEIALLYVGAGMPVLLCFAKVEDGHTEKFCQALQEVLPASVYAHLNPGVDRYFLLKYRGVPHGRHYKMALDHPHNIVDFSSSAVQRLSVADLPAIHTIFDVAYPGNFFDPRMMETGMYFGVWEREQLVSVAGIHVYSEAYDVAGIGNVTTHPAYRGKGYAKKVVARLIEALQEKVSHIALHVKADNLPAIKAYEQLGFRIICEYDEYEFYAK
ncbi:MAG: GNAT family N-acetyltransferase [Anaerolineae bacterium]|jgi:ribosomal protein S18 acetylase RimI-like enzyme|nr:GNAT family N-acetyltransferase [Anaerolineae bacterium]